MDEKAFEKTKRKYYDFLGISAERGLQIEQHARLMELAKEQGHKLELVIMMIKREEVELKLKEAKDAATEFEKLRRFGDEDLDEKLESKEFRESMEEHVAQRNYEGKIMKKKEALDVVMTRDDIKDFKSGKITKTEFYERVREKIIEYERESGKDIDRIGEMFAEEADDYKTEKMLEHELKKKIRS